MDYKEKYEQALSRARNIRFGNPQKCNCKYVCEEIFPELKESEDERIKKAVIEFIKQNKAFTYCKGVSKDDCLAWLEKQGEKTIPEDINEAALRYVDTCAVDGEITHDKITEPYWNNHSMMNAYKAGWLKKQPAWSEEDESCKNTILCAVQGKFVTQAALELAIGWLKSLKERMKGE